MSGVRGVYMGAVGGGCKVEWRVVGRGAVGGEGRAEARVVWMVGSGAAWTAASMDAARAVLRAVS